MVLPNYYIINLNYNLYIMEINNLIQAREILRKEINIKDSGTKNFSELINSINCLDILIRRLKDPIKAKRLDKLTNG